MRGALRFARGRGVAGQRSPATTVAASSRQPQSQPGYFPAPGGEPYGTGIPGVHVEFDSLGLPVEPRKPTGAVRAAEVHGLPWAELKGAYCINLNRRPERWSYMQQQLARLRLPALRFPAVDGRDLDVRGLAAAGLISAKAMPRYELPDEQKLFGVDLTDGGIGCALSHMQIWREIIEGHKDGDGPFLVIEDDCEFLEGFSEAELWRRLAQVPGDWQIVFLGGQDLMRKQAALEVAPGVRRLYKGFRETTGYLITVEGAKACLEVSVPMSWQIDTHLTENEAHPPGGGLAYTVKPLGYCLVPPLVAQDRARFKTDVQKQEHD